MRERDIEQDSFTSEYPSYYKSFSCIGGICPDSCCSGWEVDVDDNSAELYKNVPFAVGKKLKEKLYRDKEGYKFHLTPDKRCPFLNDDNLCELILSMGEGALCVTCTEYPRYFFDVGKYSLVDLTLSCPEAARIFYKSHDPVRYIRDNAPLRESDWEADPYDDCAVSDDEIKDFEEDQVDFQKLNSVIRLRDEAIDLAGDRSRPLIKRLSDIVRLFVDYSRDHGEKGTLSFDNDTFFSREDATLLVQKLKTMEVVNPMWSQALQRMEKDPGGMLTEGTLFSSSGGNSCLLERFFTYLLWRYTMYIYRGRGALEVMRFCLNCTGVLLLLLGDYAENKDKYESMEHECTIEEPGSPETAFQIASRIFSRQIEHSGENINELMC
jgi:hypothetical protein